MTHSSWLSRLRGSAYLAYHLRGQARFPFQPLSAIQRAQDRRVRRMVAHAYRTVPYYRETMDRLGLGPGTFRTATDLARLPLLEREQLQHDPEYFVSTAQPLDRYLKTRSGGSTGAPCSVYHDAAALLQNTAHGERQRSIITKLVGKRLGYRITNIASPVSTGDEVRRFRGGRMLGPAGAGLRRQSLSLLDPPATTVPLINDFSPDVLQSYGSYLELMFAYLEATNAPFHRPTVVTYGGDGLSDATRRLIERKYEIPVFSSYQAVEAFKIGFECERHTGLHLNFDLYPVRVVDTAGQTLAGGESGDVVISNLVNRATVLLNYRLGDVACLLPDPCGCGRSLPLLSFPEGRSDDLIELPSGRIIHPQAIRTLFTDEEQIWQYQVVQRTETSFSVAIVAAPTCNQRQTGERIAAKFADRFGEEITVDVAFVDAIERTAGGKVRPVLSLRQRSQLTPRPAESRDA